ncbi:ThiF family adenylyltransferase, partial [Bacillus sp. SIMBA_074]|uniref:ThiF family adenylyltransferase n=2 Tax=Bacillaceae TaxID=186817 RepID=UPI00397B257B
MPAKVADPTYDRQARIFGDRGQAILASSKVAVVGLGGIGSLIGEYLARLGVGELLYIDPDRLDPTNLPRVVGARRSDVV